MKPDAFPNTLNTWIGNKLGAGIDGRQDINRHIMEVYGWPLLVYLRGHSGRHLGEPEELIHEFFADRLDRQDFFVQWQQSGLALRRWLMNALNFYLKEHRRRLTSREKPGTEITSDLYVTDARPEQAMDRAFAQSIVAEALNKSREHCEANGLGAHFTIFMQHFYEGRRYEDIAPDHGIDAARAAVMARTASRAFRTVLRDMFDRDGTAPEDIDREIQTLREEISE
jgi:DNA-directed RNA polymerase specialized sigma24 family protein